MQNFFLLFDLPASYALDPSELEKRYFAAQRQFHPDRLLGKSPAERQQAIRQSMLINEAYEALKNPLRRAQHLLALAGVQPDSAKPAQELLMEIMERREELAETGSAESLASLAERNAVAGQDVVDGLLQAFAESDMNKASQLVMRLSYLTKLGDEIRARVKSLP